MQVQEKNLTASEIITFFIKKTKGDSVVNGNYIIVSGPVCKGCVQQTLTKLDSIIDNKAQWIFITSHRFILQYHFKNIHFIYDENWRNINLDLVDVSYFRIKEDSIVYSDIPLDIQKMDKIFKLD